jgi:[ribosomal protein S18]-alanine N-acetyltransferase
VRPTNERARHLYARFGFREIGRRVAYYKDNGEDAIIMQTDDLASDEMRARLDALRSDLEDRHPSTDWGVRSS